VTVDPLTSILEARRLLGLHGIRHLPVVAGEKVLGVVSDREVTAGDQTLERTVEAMDSQPASGRSRRVSEVMTQPPHTIDAGATLTAAADLLVRHRIDAAAVTSGGRLVGMISVVDLLRRQVARDKAWENHPSRAQPPLRLAPSGDERPGRPLSARTAVIIDPSPAARLERANELRIAGCTVFTCPGPLAGVTCLGKDGCADERCPRVPACVDVLVCDKETAATPLLDAYAEWAPDATVEIVGAGAR
jgi:CBS domain-containing protein